MNVVLLNLTRFGDLLQSQAAITDLVRLGHKVAVVCLSNFAPAASLLSGVSHVAPLPGSEFLRHLSTEVRNVPEDRTAAGVRQDWHAALASLASWRDVFCREFPPDVVCNLTPTIAARMLSLFVADGKPCAGFAVDEHGFGRNGDAWAGFMQGASLERGVSPFNVTDMFRMIALDSVNGRKSEKLPRGDASLRPVDGGRQEIVRDLKDRLPRNCNGYVAFQLGASVDRRRWPVELFAELGDILWQEERLCPVLLGSRSEISLAERYAGLARQPHVSLCGRTGLEELAAVLGAAKLLVSNDTGTMHLAAGVGIPLLGIFLATAQPFDTGPYIAGSCCMEADMDCHPCSFRTACSFDNACRSRVRPDVVAAFALSRLRTGSWYPEKMSPDMSGARIWVSGYDDQGFMDLRSLSGHENDARTVWLGIQRHHIRRFLDRDREEEFKPGCVQRVPALAEKERLDITAALTRTGALIRLLLEQGNVLLSRPVPVMRQRFLATWQKIYDSLRDNRNGRALALLWAQETQSDGQDLPAVLRQAGNFLALLDGIFLQLSDIYCDTM